MAIVRTCEVNIIPERHAEFMEKLHDLVRTFPDTYAGLEHHEILVDRANPLHLIYRSRWRDADALVGYAGKNWETDAVSFPGEDELLEDGMHLTHFDVE